jgi:hypothetical protein
MNKKPLRPNLSLSQITVHNETDPIRSFYSGIKAEETRTSYTKTLKEFLFSIEDLSGTKFITKNSVLFITIYVL